MNKVAIVGRLVRDPEVKYTNSGDKQMAVAKFTVACNRKFKKDGQNEADFISCVAFGKTAEFIEKYFQKGNAIGLTGTIQTGSYTNKDGNKVYTTDVLIEEVEFVERRQDASSAPEQTKTSDDGFMNIPEGIDEELPFQ